MSFFQAVFNAAMKRYHGVAWELKGGSVERHVNTISGIIVCCVIAMSLKPLPAAAERLSPERVANSLAEGYVTTEKKGAEETDSAVSQEDIKGFISFRFKSTGPLAGSSPPTYGRFHLRFYEYGSVDAAAAALVKFAADVQASIFYKSPMLAFADGPVLTRLDGECLFSREDWGKIERTLLAAVFPAGEPKGFSLFRMLCGGAVASRPAEDPGR